MNLRDRLTEDLRRVKGRIDNWIDRYFPEFGTVFKVAGGKAAMLTLESFPLPQEIVNAGIQGVVATWKQEISRAVGEKQAMKLVATAKNSIGLTEGTIMARQEIKTLLGQYKALEQEIEQLMTQIEIILKQIPGTEEMMSIPGVGMVTVAGFLAETGDLEGYRHPRQTEAGRAKP